MSCLPSLPLRAAPLARSGHSGALSHQDDIDLFAMDIVIIVVDESKEKDILLSDSHVIATTLLIRDIQAEGGLSSDDEDNGERDDERELGAHLNRIADGGGGGAEPAAGGSQRDSLSTMDAAAAVVGVASELAQRRTQRHSIGETARHEVGLSDDASRNDPAF